MEGSIHTCIDPHGNLIITKYDGLYLMDSTGNESSISGSSGIFFTNVTMDRDGNMYLLTYEKKLFFVSKINNGKYKFDKKNEILLPIKINDPYNIRISDNGKNILILQRKGDKFFNCDLEKTEESVSIKINVEPGRGERTILMRNNFEVVGNELYTIASDENSNRNGRPNCFAANKRIRKNIP